MKGLFRDCMSLRTQVLPIVWRCLPLHYRNGAALLESQAGTTTASKMNLLLPECLLKREGRSSTSSL